MAFRCRGVRAVGGRAIVAGERLENRHLLATFVVTNLLNAGAGSLREAVTQANEAAGDDTIRFAPVLAGTIVLASGQLDVIGGLSIDGPGAAKLAVSGNDSSRIFALKGTEARLSIDDISLSNGRATVLDPVGPGLVRGGAIRNDGGTLVLWRVTFSRNSAVSDPTQSGAAAIVGGGAVVIPVGRSSGLPTAPSSATRSKGARATPSVARSPMSQTPVPASPAAPSLATPPPARRPPMEVRSATSERACWL